MLEYLSRLEETSEPAQRGEDPKALNSKYEEGLRGGEGKQDI